MLPARDATLAVVANATAFVEHFAAAVVAVPARAAPEIALAIAKGDPLPVVPAAASLVEVALFLLVSLPVSSRPHPYPLPRRLSRASRLFRSSRPRSQSHPSSRSRSCRASSRSRLPAPGRASTGACALATTGAVARSVAPNQGIQGGPHGLSRSIGEVDRTCSARPSRAHRTFRRLRAPTMPPVGLAAGGGVSRCLDAPSAAVAGRSTSHRCRPWGTDGCPHWRRASSARFRSVAVLPREGASVAPRRASVVPRSRLGRASVARRADR